MVVSYEPMPTVYHPLASVSGDGRCPVRARGSDVSGEGAAGAR